LKDERLKKEKKKCNWWYLLGNDSTMVYCEQWHSFFFVVDL